MYQKVFQKSASACLFFSIKSDVTVLSSADIVKYINVTVKNTEEALTYFIKCVAMKNICPNVLFGIEIFCNSIHHN